MTLTLAVLVIRVAISPLLATSKVLNFSIFHRTRGRKTDQNPILVSQSLPNVALTYAS